MPIGGCGGVLVICMVISPCPQLIGSRVEWRLGARLWKVRSAARRTACDRFELYEGFNHSDDNEMEVPWTGPVNGLPEITNAIWRIAQCGISARRVQDKLVGSHLTFEKRYCWIFQVWNKGIGNSTSLFITLHNQFTRLHLTNNTPSLTKQTSRNAMNDFSSTARGFFSPPSPTRSALETRFAWQIKFWRAHAAGNKEVAGNR